MLTMTTCICETGVSVELHVQYSAACVLLCTCNISLHLFLLPALDPSYVPLL